MDIDVQLALRAEDFDGESIEEFVGEGDERNLRG
jgi:hypothetical protein